MNSEAQNTVVIVVPDFGLRLLGLAGMIPADILPAVGTHPDPSVDRGCLGRLGDPEDQVDLKVQRLC